MKLGAGSRHGADIAQGQAAGIAGTLVVQLVEQAAEMGIRSNILRLDMSVSSASLSALP
jgi:hypothetical protein